MAQPKDKYAVNLPLQYAAALNQYYPLLISAADLDSVPEKLEASERRGKSSEFCCSWTFSPSLVDATAFRGYFPMAVTAYDNFIMAVKCHKSRCVMDPAAVVIAKGTRQRSRKYDITVDTMFDEVTRMCVLQHSENWLCPTLQMSFKFIHQRPELFNMKIHSIELWRGNELVAGELGYCIGNIYTSLTGFYTESGSGLVQLVGLAKMLSKCGFKLWDFGMAMTYKLELGGSTMARYDWLAHVKSVRDDKSATLKFEKANVRNLIDGVEARPTTPTPTPPSGSDSAKVTEHTMSQ